MLGKSPEEQLNHLNNLYLYCNSWGLNVNTSKTKIMVFRKRGKIRQDEKWTYNGQNIEIVDNFNYLGTVFNYTGSFNLNQEHLVGKALKAMNILLYKCKQYDLKPKLFCQLFDSFVGSICCNASKIWFVDKSKEIGRIHLNFCKRLLNVKISTCNATVYGKLGRYPLYVNRYVRIVKYWLKIINSNNIIIRTVYIQALNDCNKGCKNWVANVKQLLNDYGFSYCFESANITNSHAFVCELKCRIIDTFKQEWFGNMNGISILDMYRMFKTTFEYEHYLDLLPKSLRLYFVKLRASAHPLRIQTGRYTRNNIPREERYCLCCNQRDIEDEFHFICVCSCYRLLRQKYIKRFYYMHPSVVKFHNLLISTCKIEIFNVCKYVKEALIVRNTILNTTN